MQDLISRQAAIDALNDEYHGMISDESMKIYQIIKWLEELPSAKPDANSRIERAIRTLQKNYNLALSRDYIQNPIAWALYETWKEFDR